MLERRYVADPPSPFVPVAGAFRKVFFNLLTLYANYTSIMSERRENRGESPDIKSGD